MKQCVTCKKTRASFNYKDEKKHYIAKNIN